MLLKRKVSYAKHRGSLRTWTGADTGTEAPLLGLQPEKFISVDFTEHKGGSSEALLPQMWTPEPNSLGNGLVVTTFCDPVVTTLCKVFLPLPDTEFESDMYSSCSSLFSVFILYSTIH